MAGELAEAEALLAKVIEAFEGVGDPLGLADSLSCFGSVLRQRGETEAAIPPFERARQLYQECGHRRGVADCLMGLSTEYRNRGEVGRAEELLVEARRTFQGVEDHAGVAGATNVLAEIARLRGHLQAAGDGYREALRIYEQLGMGEAFVPAAAVAGLLDPSTLEQSGAAPGARVDQAEDAA